VNASWQLRRGTGADADTCFLELARQQRPDGLQLRTFASNVRARRFYERDGFVIQERTDGSGNEEHAPDLRYARRPETREGENSAP
jgi:ribosomal protein S18 acetylase RimI-like enzyme